MDGPELKFSSSCPKVEVLVVVVELTLSVAVKLCGVADGARGRRIGVELAAGEMATSIGAERAGAHLPRAGGGLLSEKLQRIGSRESRQSEIRGVLHIEHAGSTLAACTGGIVELNHPARGRHAGTQGAGDKSKSAECAQRVGDADHAAVVGAGCIFAGKGDFNRQSCPGGKNGDAGGRSVYILESGGDIAHAVGGEAADHGDLISSGVVKALQKEGILPVQRGSYGEEKRVAGHSTGRGGDRCDAGTHGGSKPGIRVDGGDTGSVAAPGDGERCDGVAVAIGAGGRELIGSVRGDRQRRRCYFDRRQRTRSCRGGGCRSRGTGVG